MLKPLISALMVAGMATTVTAQAEPTSEVVLRSDITFQPLNPLRGDASPKAGVVWGDIKKDIPTGVFLEFADGFSSPPHIHNITYRAVVISGAVHNDDPKAENMWMGPGSFWTQPAGESHITAAKPGAKATAFLEILEGPYLVQPSDKAFDNGERPINVDDTNIIWLDASDVEWVEPSGSSATGSGPEMAFLWGSSQDDQKNGTFLKLPPEYSGTLRGDGSSLRAVLVQGDLAHQTENGSGENTLDPGSYFGSTGAVAHQISCDAGDACILYLSAEGKYRIAPS